MAIVKKNTAEDIKPSIEYRIDDFILESSCVDTSKSKIKIEELDLSFKVAIEQQIDIKAGLVSVKVEIEAFDQEDCEIGHVKTKISFEVKNIESYYVKETKKLRVPAGFIDTITLMAIDSSRGVVLSVFAPEKINAIFPAVDLSIADRDKRRYKILSE